jgi:hypothetical protein
MTTDRGSSPVYSLRRVNVADLLPSIIGRCQCWHVSRIVDSEIPAE